MRESGDAAGVDEDHVGIDVDHRGEWRGATALVDAESAADPVVGSPDPVPSVQPELDRSAVGFRAYRLAVFGHGDLRAEEDREARQPRRIGMEGAAERANDGGHAAVAEEQSDERSVLVQEVEFDRDIWFVTRWGRALRCRDRRWRVELRRCYSTSARGNDASIEAEALAASISGRVLPVDVASIESAALAASASVRVFPVEVASIVSAAAAASASGPTGTKVASIASVAAAASASGTVKVASMVSLAEPASASGRVFPVDVASIALEAAAASNSLLGAVINAA